MAAASSGFAAVPPAPHHNGGAAVASSVTNSEREAVVARFAAYAREHLNKGQFDYYNGGAEDEITLRDNEAAFARLDIRPAADGADGRSAASTVSLSASVLGMRLTSPIGIAPTSRHKICHPEGECATAAAAAGRGQLMVVSTSSSCDLESIAQAARDAASSSSSPNLSSSPLLWFQLYLYKGESAGSELVRRAEAAGYGALVLTVDMPVYGSREADKRNDFPVQNYELGNFTQAHGRQATDLTPDLNWSLVQRSRDMLQLSRRLPVLVKGVLTREDAAAACAAGVDGIIVSNHGGRQLDSAAATIEALWEVAAAVRAFNSSEARRGQPAVEVFVDGGVRHGSDVFKALALGARAVFIGRAALWGLAADGRRGVETVLAVLDAQLQAAMQAAGCSSVEQIGPQHLAAVIPAALPSSPSNRAFAIAPPPVSSAVTKRFTITDYRPVTPQRQSSADGFEASQRLRWTEDDSAGWLAWRIRPRVMISVGTVDLRTSLLACSLASPLTLVCDVSPSETGQTPPAAAMIAQLATSRGLALAVLGQAQTAITDGLQRTAAVFLQVSVRAGFKESASRISQLAASHCAAAILSWDDEGNVLSWHDLRQLTTLGLPLIVKGLLTAADATLACQHGASAIWVSGSNRPRHPDSQQIAIDALPGIALAVQLSRPAVQLMVDGGIRRGTDVFKALALGVTAVCLTDSLQWGWAADGQHGLQAVTDILHAELERVMALAGCPAISHIIRQRVCAAHELRITNNKLQSG